MPYINTKTNTFGHNIYEVREAHPEASIPDGVDYGDFVWYAPTNPEFDPAAYRAIESQPSHVDGKLVQTWDVVPLSASELADRLIAERSGLITAATRMRWQKEEGGITLPNGVRVGTTKEDQNRITSVIANAANAGVESVDFKATTGWVSLSVVEIQFIAGAIARHVQAHFTAERAHHEAIEALETMGQLRAYDLNTGWPE